MKVGETRRVPGMVLWCVTHGLEWANRLAAA